MNEIWVLSVRTSLPNNCPTDNSLHPEMEAFDNFEKGLEAMRAKLKELAFSENLMFDGN